MCRGMRQRLLGQNNIWRNGVREVIYLYTPSSHKHEYILNKIGRVTLLGPLGENIKMITICFTHEIHVYELELLIDKIPFLTHKNTTSCAS